LDGARLFARKRDSLGQPFATDPEGVARGIIATLTRRSAEFILDCALAEDGFSQPELSRHPLAMAALDRRSGLVRHAMTLNVPVVGLGASAATYYGAIAALVGAPSLVPEHAEVANAVGAVIGGVHVTANIRVLQPVEGIFRVLGAGISRDLTDLAAALALAREIAAEQASAAAREAGADTVEVTVDVAEKRAMAEGRDLFIEADVTARGSGRPRIGV
jgi:hypothetical protein